MVIKRAVSVNARHDGSLLVITNPLLEEIRFTLKRDQLHPIKRIRHTVHLPVPKRTQKPIRHELNILTHQVPVHPHQRARKRVAHKLPLDLHRVAHDRLHALFRELRPQEGIDQAREVAVKAFVSRDQLVGEGEPRHEPTLLEPEDRAEATGEEDPFDASERHDPLGESLRSVDPLHGPLGLLRDARDGLNRAEEMVPLLVVLDVRI